VELDHHGTIHFGTICVHTVDALHAYQVVTSTLDLHHVLVVSTLIICLTVVQVLVDRYVLQVVFVLLFAAQSQLGAFVELISIALNRNVHHYQVFSYSILIISPHSNRVMIHLALVIYSRTNA